MGGKTLAVLAFRSATSVSGYGAAHLFEVPIVDDDGDDGATSETATATETALSIRTTHATIRSDPNIASLLYAGYRPRDTDGAAIVLFLRRRASASRGGSAAGSWTTTLDTEIVAYPRRLREGTTIIVAGASSSSSSSDAAGGTKKKRKAGSYGDGGIVAIAPGDQGREASTAADLIVVFARERPKKDEGRDT